VSISVHPFDVMVVLLLVTAGLPTTLAIEVFVWLVLQFVAIRLLRQRERPRGLPRAIRVRSS
jgi:hypothetical protein